MSKILIFDTECNSLDTEKGFVQELAWAIYDLSSWRLLKSQSSLARWNTVYDVEPGAFAATNLTREFCESHGAPAHYLFTEFLSDAYDVDYVCGHNVIVYDIPMMTSNIKRACLFEAKNSHFMEKHVIDTLIDCPYPATQKILALKYLALDHGYVLSDAHQAIADVFACKAILSKYDFEKVLEISKTPVVTITCKPDWNNLEGRGLVKNARFYWNPDRKLWFKSIREFYLNDIQESLAGGGVSVERESKVASLV